MECDSHQLLELVDSRPDPPDQCFVGSCMRYAFCRFDRILVVYKEEDLISGDGARSQTPTLGKHPESLPAQPRCLWFRLGTVIPRSLELLLGRCTRGPRALGCRKRNRP